MARRVSQEKQPILPESVIVFLRRRVDEVFGVLLFLIATYVLLSLLTYDMSDPSWNTSIDGPAHNVGGPFGAYLSDALLQVFGWTSFFLVIVLYSWARLKFVHQPIYNLWLKIVLLPASLLSLSVTVGALLKTNSFSTLHIAGASGSVIADNLQQILNFLGKPFAWIITVAVSFFIFTVLFMYVSGLRGREWGVLYQSLLGIFGFFMRKLTKLLNFSRTSSPKKVKASQSPRNKVQKLETPIDRYGPDLAFDQEPKTLIETEEESSEEIEEEIDDEPLHFDLPDMKDYQLPSLDLLTQGDNQASALSERQLQENASRLKEVLEDFGIRGEIIKVRPGPVVTLYELMPAPGVKSSRIIGLSDDIARSMSAISARVAVIPGRNAIGIELPNESRETVYLRELLASSAYERAGGSLPLALGKDISGASIIADLARMPHLLVAGTTGSGKSVSVNSMILSLLYRLPPDRCKLIMIDPKMLELSVYDGIPHLLTPVVTDPKKAVVALKWTVREMENRYRGMSKLGVRNIVGYNMRVTEAKAKGENLDRKVQTGFDPDSGKPIYESQALDLEPLPYIVVVVDEMADLMLVAGKDIEAAVQRLAQMARAAGIHIIMATQRPSVDVITGTIKANFPTRISFQVTSKIDSRTILGEQGAEQLLGMGDMLYMAPGGRITRVHGPFVTDEEVDKIVKFLKSQGTPSYLEDIIDESDTADIFGISGSEGGEDLYDQAVALIIREGKISTSFIQRHFQIGYNRAARIVEKMEQEGIISEASRTGKREILVSHAGG